MSHQYIIGLMSGTSLDGVDAALVRFEKNTSKATKYDYFDVIGKLFTPYSEQLQQDIHQAVQSQQHQQEERENSSILIKTLDNSLSHIYAKTCLQLIESANIPHDNIDAIANHGQTIAHYPNAVNPYSTQLGNGKTIASITHIPTITQFRQNDLNAGGQGAPLMPAFHQALLHKDEHCLVLNMGGIANITQLSDTLLGFDTGPANTLLDQWIQHCLHTHKYDKDGQWALSGNAQSKILEVLLSDPFFHLAAPKSTGPDYFNLTWLNKQLRNATQTKQIESYRPQDIQATLMELTAYSIAQAIHSLSIPTSKTKCYLCGGGAKNTALVSRLKAHLPHIEFIHFHQSEYANMGVDGDYLEAIGFAWLGYCYLHGIPSNAPSVTGANKKVVLGKCYLPE